MGFNPTLEGTALVAVSEEVAKRVRGYICGAEGERKKERKGGRDARPRIKSVAALLRRQKIIMRAERGSYFEENSKQDRPGVCCIKCSV